MGNKQTHLFDNNGFVFRFILYALKPRRPDKFNFLLLSKMSGINSEDSTQAVLLLTTRLAKAEQRLKILTREVSAIKQELGSLQQGSTPSTSIREFSTSAIRPASDIDGPSSSRSTTNGNSGPKRPRYDFMKDGEYVVVYTDGACENNGRPNAKAGIGVWFGDNHPLNVSEPLAGKATNNRAEIHACVEAIKMAHRKGVTKLKIKTDSQFVINSMTAWIHNWKKNNWKTASKNDVKNKEDFVILDIACKLLDDIQWEHVRGHNGVAGNEGADKLAVAGALRYR